ncbi:MAG: hypothetical protein ACD_13C00108G0001 [uncultured bacterium]|nr:MAG: hypothetical protein ACD_13C00108G0001 [uncultured bacterium]HAU65188.1 hypothetical protein [Candidatus Woesebacteria bacterium]HCC09086.1 hypothetical protein [Candidatus Woesebacteria bacterium]
MKKLTSPFTLIKKSLEIFTKKENFLFLIKIYLPVAVLSLISLAFINIPFLSKTLDASLGNAVNIVVGIIFLVFSVFMSIAGIMAVIRIIDGKNLRVEGVYKEAFSKFGIFFLLTITIYLINLLGLVLLIVPFVLVVIWFAFSKFVMVDKGVGIKVSLLESKGMVKGIFWQVLGRLIIFGLFWFFSQMVLSVLPFGIGTVIYGLCGGLFVIPSFLLYREING